MDTASRRALDLGFATTITGQQSTRFDAGIVQNVELPANAVVASAEFYGGIDDFALAVAVNDRVTSFAKPPTGSNMFGSARSYQLPPEGFGSGGNRLIFRFENISDTGPGGIMGQLRITYYVHR